MKWRRFSVLFRKFLKGKKGNEEFSIFIWFLIENGSSEMIHVLAESKPKVRFQPNTLIHVSTLIDFQTHDFANGAFKIAETSLKSY